MTSVKDKTSEEQVSDAAVTMHALTAATVEARPAEQAWATMSPVVVAVVTLIVVCLCALGVGIVFFHIG